MIAVAYQSLLPHTLQMTMMCMKDNKAKYMQMTDHVQEGRQRRLKRQ